MNCSRTDSTAKPSLSIVKPPRFCLLVRELNKHSFISGFNEKLLVESYLPCSCRRYVDSGQDYHRASVLNNRAACHLKIGDCRSAIVDCSDALDLVPQNTKGLSTPHSRIPSRRSPCSIVTLTHRFPALLRRATAKETLERYVDAYVDYRHITNLDPTAGNAFAGASRYPTVIPVLSSLLFSDGQQAVVS
mgnify:CR=1 FL=1